MTIRSRIVAGMDDAPTAPQVYRIFIRASAEQVWQGITDPAFIARYFHGSHVRNELRAGGRWLSMSPDGQEVWNDGQVLECDPPRRLVQTWRMAMDPQAAAEGFTRLTYEITEGGGAGVCRLTVIHEVGTAPTVAAMVEGAPGAEQQLGGGGWPWILSDLKTLLETGSSFTSPAAR